MLSIEEGGYVDAEKDSPITKAEITEVLKKLFSGRAPGVDEIHPEIL